MRVIEEGKKTGLKLNFQKTKIMVSGPIISWQIDWEAMETETDFIFLGYKMTSDGDCSHEINKRYLLLGRKAMTNLDSTLSRDITDKATVFPVVMYGSESWIIKKAECRRIDALELWCWRKLLSPLDSKEIKPINPKGINPEYSLEGLILKLQYFGHPDVKSQLIGKDPDAGKD